jgi:thymidylate synthase
MKQYQEMLRDIMAKGKIKRNDRTGTGMKQLIGYTCRYDLSEGFPLVTTKKTPFRIIAEELLWFIRGETNIRPLLEKNVHIWSEWPFKAWVKATDQTLPTQGTEEWTSMINDFEKKVLESTEFAERYGDLGPVYGKQWREWETPEGELIDQIDKVVEGIKRDPGSQRHIVSAWNVADIDEMVKSGLPPCHTMFQFLVEEGKLYCILYQRSADTFLGVPFNIASYSLLTLMIAQICGLEPGEFIHFTASTHIYLNHFDEVEILLSREPKPLPTLKINPDVKGIFDFKIEDFTLEGYESWATIKAQIAV